MEQIYNIALMFSKEAVLGTYFTAVQGDVGTRIIRAAIYNDNGTPFNPGTGVAAKYVSRKADGTGTEHSDGVSISGNMVDVELAEQDLAAPGIVYAAIVLMKDDTELTSIPFRFKVMPRPVGADVRSQNDYEAYNKALDALSNAPIIDPVTNHWKTWSVDQEQYIDTGVIASGEGAVSYAIDQSLTEAQKSKARANIDAASETDVSDLKENLGQYKYGVSGLLNASPALTRLYDAVGLTAAVGTDTQTAVNDFDNRLPFARRKCVGRWQMVLGKPVFEVAKYMNEDGYTEDGSIGDYVAVECPKAYFKLEGTELAVSAHKFEGFRPFDIFCRKHDVNDVMDLCYLPAYALAVDADDHAVSLPGYDNEQGSYKMLFDKARTYGGGSMGNFAVLQPAAVNFYEWALFTVEFATNNCQSIMQGCSALRHNNDDRLTFKDATHVLVQNYFASRVAGEYISILATDIDINAYRYHATHKIVSATRCDESGSASASGTYQLLELEDLGKEYYTYDLTGATEYRIAARPYRTGACNGVLTPSGSPASNTDTYHPMRYRYRENVYGNQYKTVVDLFNMRVGTGDDDYKLEWYLLADPSALDTPKDFGTADLATDAFIKLSVETEHANYVNGYIKSKKYDPLFPDIWIPYETTGGSASTYFSDYAYLVFSPVVRAVRFGGLWNLGGYAGFSIAYAANAPSSGSAAFGGDLCFIQ